MKNLKFEDVVLVCTSLIGLFIIFFLFIELGRMKVSEQQMQKQNTNLWAVPQPKSTEPVHLNKLGIDYQKKGTSLEEVLKYEGFQH